MVAQLLFTEVVVILGLRSLRTLSRKVSKASGFVIKSTAGHLEARIILPVLMHKSNAESTKNHLYVPR